MRTKNVEMLPLPDQESLKRGDLAIRRFLPWCAANIVLMVIVFVGAISYMVTH